MKRILTLEAGCILLAAFAAAQSPYNATPDWESSDTPYSTGGALVDLDRDGWLDLVVSNGNDMRQERLAVYYNQGDGTLPLAPDWQSSDTVYNGHLDVADVNADGWPDVAVATLGTGYTFGPIARVYLNTAGTLSATPSWSANITGNAFGVAFGDMNNDGRPDLAVATGWSYSPQRLYKNYVYLNTGTALEATPSWASDDTNHLQGVLWVDADDDGWLDLVGAASRTRSRCYRNLGGTLETTASWFAMDFTSEDAIMATAGDVDNDGDLDLFLTDNTQLAGGSGLFRQYNGLATGMFATTYSWSYYCGPDGYGSAVALADIDGDGDLDLATGGWWSSTRLFFNSGTGFGASPGWTSGGESVHEKIVFGDVDKNSLRTVETTFPPAGTRRLFYLPNQPIQEAVEVCRDGLCLQPSQYMVNREHGWVTVAAAPTIELKVTYTVSTKLDMAITNWDDELGNYLYYNQLVVMGDANCDGRLNAGDIPDFVLLLTDRLAYDTKYPDCDADTFCDMDGSGAINAGDIPGFVDALTGGG